MHAVLGMHCYGKSDIMLTGVTNGRIREMIVSVEMVGGMEEVFRNGVNQDLLPTSSLENAAAVLLHEHLQDPAETFAVGLARNLSATCRAVSLCKVRITEKFWSPESHGGSTRGPGGSDGSILITAESRGAQVALHAGYQQISLFKPGGTSFAGFLRDRFTDATETEDRPVRGMVSIAWRYSLPAGDHRVTGPLVRKAFLAGFMRHKGNSVQHSLHAAAVEAVHAVPDICAVALDYESVDSIQVDLARFDRSSSSSVVRSWPRPRHRISLTVGADAATGGEEL
ncbi:hypothetical protein ACFWZY_22425 [Streptomyces sp. NPDC058992]|uniref:hypothetical protein n=1 Tax=Streptomyces sp. NPDC058992 TaxID=3346688 RepID=UPI00369F993A